ncbi:hypothetical protein V8C44DRAFT_216081 [Trichoderma aethiopicum]
MRLHSAIEFSHFASRDSSTDGSRHHFRNSSFLLSRRLDHARPSSGCSGLYSTAHLGQWCCYLQFCNFHIAVARETTHPSCARVSQAWVRSMEREVAPPILQFLQYHQVLRLFQVGNPNSLETLTFIGPCSLPTPRPRRHTRICRVKAGKMSPSLPVRLAILNGTDWLPSALQAWWSRVPGSDGALMATSTWPLLHWEPSLSRARGLRGKRKSGAAAAAVPSRAVSTRRSGCASCYGPEG